MRTIVLTEPGSFAVVDTPPPASPGPGEALVRVRRIGVCGTDLHAFRGRQPFFTYPRILGHELGVEVAALGPDVAGIEIGDRCAVEPYLDCGVRNATPRCVACRRGRTNCCTQLQCLGVHCDGGMREFIVVPAAKLHKSGRLSLDQLALVETLGIGAHAVARAESLSAWGNDTATHTADAAVAPSILAGELALVVGAGPIGLAVAQFVLLAGARVAVLDVRPDRLEFCRRLGVQHVLDGRVDSLAQLEEISAGELAVTVFDATGSAASMARSFDYTAHGGTLVYVGLVQADVTFHDPHFHRREISLLASRNSTAADFRRIIGLMEAGRIDTTPWITHRAAFDDTIGQFPSWLEPENRVVKAIIGIGD